MFQRWKFDWVLKKPAVSCHSSRNYFCFELFGWKNVSLIAWLTEKGTSRKLGFCTKIRKFSSEAYCAWVLRARAWLLRKKETKRWRVIYKCEWWKCKLICLLVCEKYTGSSTESSSSGSECCSARCEQKLAVCEGCMASAGTRCGCSVLSNQLCGQKHVRNSSLFTSLIFTGCVRSLFGELIFW